MSAKSHIHVRQMETGDFEFVRTLAARQPTFTVPSPYVLWLVSRIKNSVCLVAEDASLGHCAYMIALPIEAPNQTLHVWQLAGLGEKNSDAVVALLVEFRKTAKRLGVHTISFSTIPGSSALRRIQTYTKRVFATTALRTSALPQEVSQSEDFYQFEM